MQPTTSLEARVASLERSLRRSRRTAAALGLATLVLAAAAFTQQMPPSLEAQLAERLDARLQTLRLPEAQEQIATERLSLTDEQGAELVVLAGGIDGSLLVLTPTGAEIVRLGGSPARHIDH